MTISINETQLTETKSSGQSSPYDTTLITHQIFGFSSLFRITRDTAIAIFQKCSVQVFFTRMKSISTHANQSRVSFVVYIFPALFSSPRRKKFSRNFHEKKKEETFFKKCFSIPAHTHKHTTCWARRRKQNYQKSGGNKKNLTNTLFLKKYTGVQGFRCFSLLSIVRHFRRRR